MGALAGRMIASLAEAQNYRCAYCGIRFGAEIPDFGWTHHLTRATVDHVRPRRDGGTDHWTNLVAACFRCNNLRGHEDALAFFNRKGWLSNRQRNRFLAKVQRLVREAEPVPAYVIRKRRQRKAAWFRGLTRGGYY